MMEGCEGGGGRKEIKEGGEEEGGVVMRETGCKRAFIRLESRWLRRYSILHAAFLRKHQGQCGIQDRSPLFYLEWITQGETGGRMYVLVAGADDISFEKRLGELPGKAEADASK